MEIKMQSNAPVLSDVMMKITNGGLDRDKSLSMFTRLLEGDEVFSALLDTSASKTLRGLVKNGDISKFYNYENGKIHSLKGIPRMSFSPLTASADSCCVVAGDLQLCEKDALIKMLCLEQCTDEATAMANSIGGATEGSSYYAAFRALSIANGVSQSSLPTLKQFQQLSLIAQFVFLIRITMINGIVSAERNNNVIKRFHGLEEVFSQADVLSISGGSGIISAFDSLMCRIDLFGLDKYKGAFFAVTPPAMSAIRREIVEKTNGTYPGGWNVITTVENSRPVTRYFFMGIPIKVSTETMVDKATMKGEIKLVSDSVGVFSAMPLDVPAQFILDQYKEGEKSEFLHWNSTAKAYPDCWQDCERVTNIGTVMALETSSLAKVTGIDSRCDLKVYKGLEGLINVNSLSPYTP